MRCGFVASDLCFLCQGAKQTWVHLWAQCPALAHLRRSVGPRHPRTPLGRDLQAFCGAALRTPRDLPPAMASLGIAVEVGGELGCKESILSDGMCVRRVGIRLHHGHWYCIKTIRVIYGICDLGRGQCEQ